MSLITERFNGGSNGTNLQQAGVNVSETIVNPNNAATLKFSNVEASPFTGGLVAVSTAGSGVQAEVRHDRTAATQGAQAFDFKVPSAAPTGASLDIMQSRGTVQNAGIRLHTDGSLRVLNLGSEIGGTATLTNFIATYAGMKVRIDLVVIEGTTSSNGRILARLRDVTNLGSTLWSYDSGTTRNAGVIGTDTVTSYRALKITAASVLSANFVVYGHDANDGIATYVADPSLFAGAPSGSLPTRELVHRYDFSSWANKTSVAAVVTSGPALTINVVGFLVSVVDVTGRTATVDVQFTVTGAGGTTVVTDTIPVGGTSLTQVIEEVIATAATGTAGDWS